MQRNEPRRSSRLAEQRLAAGGTSTGGTSSGSAAVGTGTTAVAEAVAEAERRIAAVTPGRKRGRPPRESAERTPVANADVPATEEDESETEETGEERRGKRNRTPSPSSVSSESSSDGGSDDPMLKSCWMYRTTKMYYREVLPVPFKVSNARIVKDARLWPLLWDTVRATDDSFTNIYDLDGELTKAFESSLKLAYNTDFGDFNFGRHLPRLKSCWKLLAKVYLCSETPNEVLEGSSRVIWEDARKIVSQLDAEYLGKVLGHAAGEAYRLGCSREFQGSFPNPNPNPGAAPGNSRLWVWVLFFFPGNYFPGYAENVKNINFDAQRRVFSPKFVCRLIALKKLLGFVPSHCRNRCLLILFLAFCPCRTVVCSEVF